tara:strand:- start:295 stop:546 length:252 start_codon:yes stop_codon:yes gene_type:complete
MQEVTATSVQVLVDNKYFVTFILGDVVGPGEVTQKVAIKLPVEVASMTGMLLKRDLKVYEAQFGPIAIDPEWMLKNKIPSDAV